MSDGIGKITLYIAACGAIVSGLCFAIFGPETGIGAVVGAVLATLNSITMRWMIKKAISGSSATRSTVMFLLAFKMAILGGICYALIAVFHIDPFGFAMGLSALAFGIFLGGRAAVEGMNDEATASEES